MDHRCPCLARREIRKSLANITDVEVIVYYLQMDDPAELRAKPPLHDGLSLSRSTDTTGRINRDFYHRVGSVWHWTDRADWSEERWNHYAGNTSLHTLIARESDNPVGYAELEKVQDEVRIHLFGLLPDAIGRGNGGFFLSEVIRHAWSMQPNRITVNTCSLDHPAALQNYLNRGMRIIDTRKKSNP